MKKTARTPQQKKRDSYAKDRRNAYGERGAHSRHSIRRNKSAANRANRRAASTLLATATEAAGPEASEAVQSRIEGKRPKRWQKAPDVPLATWVQGRLRRRSALGIDDPAAVIERLDRVRSRSR